MNSLQRNRPHPSKHLNPSSKLRGQRVFHLIPVFRFFGVFFLFSEVATRVGNRCNRRLPGFKQRARRNTLVAKITPTQSDGWSVQTYCQFMKLPWWTKEERIPPHFYASIQHGPLFFFALLTLCWMRVTLSWSINTAAFKWQTQR